MTHVSTTEKELVEWTFTSAKRHNDPFNELELDVIIRHETGETWRVPAFWSGNDRWRARFSPPRNGHYTMQTICSDPADAGLHDVKAEMDVSPYAGENPLKIHGQIRVSSDHRTFEHADGAPFFWLGDTWWMGLCKRLDWPDGFKKLAADRVEKGFTVVQIVTGLYPDMPAFDPRGANEAGFPWEHDLMHINPSYFDEADRRIGWLVESGLVPCIVGCWGYYLPILGIGKMKQHWRYIIARWGAFPVIWCLAGEAAMPYYLSEDKDSDRKLQIKGWTNIGKYVREIDPFHHPVTIHPDQIGRDQVDDDGVLDFDMLQSGHGGIESAANAVAQIQQERIRKPHMPVVIGEVNYEGIIHGTQDEIQRLTFWASFLSGAAGFTYGANGIWQLNSRERPYGPSPHGGNWGDTPWEEACQFAGSHQLGLARELLMRFRWYDFEPHQEWVEPAGSPGDIGAPFAAGIPGKIRIIYFYNPTFPWERVKPAVVAIENNVKYTAWFWDPGSGEEHKAGIVDPDDHGRWQIPLQPRFSDWVLVLDAEGALV
jgi:hypothetical protein